jgi:hypothetical protein
MSKALWIGEERGSLWIDIPATDATPGSASAAAPPSRAAATSHATAGRARSAPGAAKPASRHSRSRHDD